MALKYTIFTPPPAMFAIEEYGGGNGGYAYQWRGHGPTYCTHLIVSIILVEWAHIAGGLMDHMTEHDTYRMVWHNAARWKGATNPARAESVLEGLGTLEAGALSLFMYDTFPPDRADNERRGLPVPGYNRPGTEHWIWHVNFMKAWCEPLGGGVMINSTQAMPLEQSYRWARDMEFVARECRAMAKAALQLRENRHVPK